MFMKTSTCYLTPGGRTYGKCSARPRWDTWDTDKNPFTEFKRRNMHGAAFRRLQDRFDRIILKQVESKLKPETIEMIGDSEVKVVWDGKMFGIFPSDHLGLFATLVRVD